MTPAVLLAKSADDVSRPPAQATLRGHTMMVVAAAEKLLQARGRDMLKAAGLKTEFARFQRIVTIAAFIHDLGKCSQHFQEMLRRVRRCQLVRHEAISLWLVWPGQPLSAWMAKAFYDPDDLMIAAIVAAGHHRKFWTNAIADRESCRDLSLDLYTDHTDFSNLLKVGSRRFNLPAPPQLARMQLGVGIGRSVVTSFEQWEEDWSAFRKLSQVDELVAVAKAALVCADVAGSALPAASKRLDWISRALQRRADGAKLRRIAEKRLNGQDVRDFQARVAASVAPITFVKAGCGTGKTVAALLWAAEQHGGRQIWITYPTTGTTTEGFRDNLELADVFARLDHGRRLIDLAVFGINSDAEGFRDRDRLEALRNWESEVVACTVDIVLGLIQNHRKGVYAWAGLCHSAVVFDEVHSYDEKLFAALLVFLRKLPGIPVLLMTASLPNARLEALRAIANEVHGTPLREIGGPENLENVARYQPSQTQDVVSEVTRCLDGGGKVLWVNNTVQRCIEVKEKFADALLYHSRYRYIDRIERHRAVIDAFRANGACLVSTTQVAEMSLDLSADLLVTELAPVPALIQRLGRLNRRINPVAPGNPKSFIVLEVESPLPYEAADLAEAKEWLARLGHRVLSQRDLVIAWTSHASACVTAVRSEWLDGGFSTSAAPLREGSVGLTILLAEDAEACKREPARSVGLVVPMNEPPRRLDWKKWPVVAHYPVAPQSCLVYDEKNGGQWR